MIVTRRLAASMVLSAGVALAARQNSAPPTLPIDAAFANFFHARSAREADAAADRIVASGVGFDEAFQRLKRGRDYSSDVPRGIVQGRHRLDGSDYFYTLDVPESYDAARK